MSQIAPLLPDASRGLALAGILLSVLAVGLLTALCRDCARRSRRFPSLSVGGSSVPSTWVGRAWIALLVGSFLLGLRGAPVGSAERSLEPVPVATEPGALGGGAPGELGGAGTTAVGGAGPARATVTSLRLPFWIRTASLAETVDGRRLGGTVRDTLQVPWIFLLAVLLYAVLGVRPSRRDPARARAGGSGKPGSAAGEAERGPAREASRVAAARPRGLWLALPLVLATALAALPAPRSASASGCGGIDGPLCYIYEKCERKLIIIKECTTEYAYYPEYL